jgi:hypothetical protein
VSGIFLPFQRGRRCPGYGIVVILGLIIATVPAAAAGQAAFAGPEQAVDALVAAARADDVRGLRRLFGPSGDKLVNSGDPIADKDARKGFVTAYDQTHRLERESDDKATLVIGADAWPFPIPLVRHGRDWLFDTDAGAEEILDRRIGRNELSVIEVCRAYVTAQREYATEDRQGDGLHEYAQRLESTPGRRDGLYWPVGLGEAPSPLGPFIAHAQSRGYGTSVAATDRIPYHGYLYRVLTRQGKNAPGGAYDYIAKGHMIGGFGLIAFPARYGDSGIMTFIVNQDGIVHEKNLGPATATLAERIRAYDPDATWKTP